MHSRTLARIYSDPIVRYNFSLSYFLFFSFARLVRTQFLLAYPCFVCTLQLQSTFTHAAAASSGARMHTRHANRSNMEKCAFSTNALNRKSKNHERWKGRKEIPPNEAMIALSGGVCSGSPNGYLCSILNSRIFNSIKLEPRNCVCSNEC